MEFEWDEDKRQVNIAKHGIDFRSAKQLFLKPHVGRDAKSAGNEIRHLAIGIVNDLYVTVVFTWPGDAIRVISMRRSRKDERREYRQVHGGGA